MAKFKVGDEVTIIGNVAGHMFSKGTKVYIDRTDTKAKDWDGTTFLAHYCLPIGHKAAENYFKDEGWWCQEPDLELCVE